MKFSSKNVKKNNQQQTNSSNMSSFYNPTEMVYSQEIFNSLHKKIGDEKAFQIALESGVFEIAMDLFHPLQEYLPEMSKEIVRRNQPKIELSGSFDEDVFGNPIY